ncbi:unnamed protein product [Lactuca virosa]|uniref:Cytochrome oxidase subunit II transmembrane region profile domain-containing protein n=1 Tax=Lactuca virosa TaxID=75947 RepID=A0AAU9PSM9_9ASTR|nr:unnamed protein product [Lactuca virosa]
MSHSGGNCLSAITTHSAYSLQILSNNRSNSGGALCASDLVEKRVVEVLDSPIVPAWLDQPAKSVFLNWKSKNKSLHFFGRAEQSKNETDQMIVLEWLFLIIAPCDAAEPWQLGSQDAATPMMQGIIDLHHDIFFFLILILVFVSRILVRALWHFQKEKNPIPQRIVHGTTIEILRTIFPSIIPMFIAIPSFALLYSMDEVVVNPAITIKAIGN